MILNLLIAFSAGFISFLSPCVLPLIPGYISYISGQTLNELVKKKQSVLLKTIYFSLGFSIIFIIFGAICFFFRKIIYYIFKGTPNGSRNNNNIIFFAINWNN